ncbi:hypothetical protein AcW1_008247 [Taiwanofungus camphoratus]|nr:hypothetical protein AcW1_008247 [Antrodia cinnamomea]
MLRASLVAFSAVLSTLSTAAVSVTDIQGASFQSPLVGQTVGDVTGVVTAKDKYGFWILGEPSEDPRISNGLRVYGSSVSKSVNVGDLVSLSGRVTEYRPNYSPNDLFLTELDLLHDVNVLSRNNGVKALVLGNDRTPPTGQLSAADTGPDGWLSVPNNVTLLESVNATLRPDLYGLDFWESLEEQLVQVPSPTAAGFPDRFGSIWVYGDWPVSGKNSRGGLTLTLSGTISRHDWILGKLTFSIYTFLDEDVAPNAHPEAILIGQPLDKTRNPKTSVGMTLSDITGIVTYQFENYYILPLTAPQVLSVPDPNVPPSSLISNGHPCSINVGDYNVENMGPRSHHLSLVAEHIAHYLKTPDVVFVQEIQDDSGTKDDGVVSANKTLTSLVNAIAKASNGVQYEYVNIPPQDNMDGGQLGGNIRVAYLWRPEKVSLVQGSPMGNATESTQAMLDTEGKLGLTLNPGRIDPSNLAWEEARKPLAAAWQTRTGERFYTVNVHFSSKRNSSSAQGDARPPVNGRSDRRTAQANVVAAFVKSLLAHEANASVIVAGDMNEYLQTRSVFAPLSGLLTDINEGAGIPPAERYTYVYDQNTQEIDHILVSAAVEARGVQVEHVHVNTWAASTGLQVSDHDPTVANVKVCDGAGSDQDDLHDEDSLLVQGPDYGQVIL